MRADIIQADYDQLDQIAALFGSQAEQIAQLQQTIQRGVEALQQGGWEGAAASVFYDEADGEVLPATGRLVEALQTAQTVTLQIKGLLQQAEAEAAALFNGSAVETGPEPITPSAAVGGYIAGPTQGNGGVLSWLGNQGANAWDWVVDHRDEVALGGAVIAAGIATVATSGLAAPIIAGAVAAGGITLSINAAAPQYALFNGVLQNTVSGAFIGYGVGSAGAALQTIQGISMATPWAASTGAAVSQVTGVATRGFTVARFLTYAPPVLEATGGISMAVSSGGIDFAIPEQYEQGVHTVSNVVGLGADITNLGLAFGGNRLIRYAWEHPGVHPPGGTYAGTGNSALFQSHHLYPQNALGGRLPFANELLDDAVLLPTADPLIDPKGFIPNLHTSNTGIHGALRDRMRELGGTSTLQIGVEAFRQLLPGDQLDLLQKANRQFMSSLMVQTDSHWRDILVWGGIIGMNNPDKF